MSVYQIYYKGKIKMMRLVPNEQEYRQLRGSQWQQQMVRKARRGEKVRNWKKELVEAKTQLVQMCYSCLPGSDGRLKGCTRVSGCVGMDIDIHRAHYDSDAQYEARLAELPQHILQQKDQLHLLMLERSAGSHDKQGLPKAGFHLVFSRRTELSQEENLRWASQLLGVPYDEAAKDITRVFFTTTDSDEDLLYLDAELFCNEECKDAKMQECKDEATTQHNSQSSILNYRASRMQNQACLSSAEAQPIINKVNSQSLNYHGFTFAEIISTYWELYNDGLEPCEGDRNAKTFELATVLRAICGYSLPQLMAVVPRYDGFPEEEWRQTLENALKAPQKGMLRLNRVMDVLKDRTKIRATGGTMTTPPPMPQPLPPLLELLTRNVPSYYKPALSSAVFPPLAAHLHGMKFTYWDNVEHECTFMNTLIGRQSIGKGSVRKPIDFIMADIVQRDEASRLKEAEWKRKNPMGKSKAKDPRPADICIQMLIDNLTDAVFNQRIVDANRNGGRYIYTCVDEIEALKKVTSKGTVDEVSLLIRKAFDNSMAGQERVGADSVSGIAPLRWNWNASTTPPNARKFFYRAVNDGTIGRLDISTIMVDDDTDEDPVMGIYDQHFADELKPYLERLEQASGHIECPEARELALQMKQENKDNARLYDSEAYKILSYRANVIAWLKGMLLYVAHGCQWSQEIADFVHWTQQYNLWCKMLYFGTQLERELRDEREMMRGQMPQNLLDLLPTDFSKAEYRQLRQNLGKPGDGDSTLRTWMSRSYIELDEVTGNYRKTAEYFNRGNGYGRQ